jgi:hypothetical protein
VGFSGTLLRAISAKAASEAQGTSRSEWHLVVLCVGDALVVSICQGWRCFCLGVGGRHLATALRSHLDGKPAGAPICGGTWHSGAVGAEMLRRDLDAAGIPYAVEGPDGPEYADFHALRHTYLTMLGRNGVDLRTAQELTGHSTPELTPATRTAGCMTWPALSRSCRTSCRPRHHPVIKGIPTPRNSLFA